MFPTGRAPHIDSEAGVGGGSRSSESGGRLSGRLQPAAAVGGGQGRWAGKPSMPAEALPAAVTCTVALAQAAGILNPVPARRRAPRRGRLHTEARLHWQAGAAGRPPPGGPATVTRLSHGDWPPGSGYKSNRPCSAQRAAADSVGLQTQPGPLTRRRSPALSAADAARPSHSQTQPGPLSRRRSPALSLAAAPPGPHFIADALIR
jgi:hypothetical protein